MAWAAAFALILYAYGLGAAALLVWRYYRGPIRYAPIVATAAYYLAALQAHPPVFVALQSGAAYPDGDAWRTITSCVAFGLSLLLLAQLIGRKK